MDVRVLHVAFFRPSPRRCNTHSENHQGAGEWLLGMLETVGPDRLCGQVWCAAPRGIPVFSVFSSQTGRLIRKWALVLVQMSPHSLVVTRFQRQRSEANMCQPPVCTCESGDRELRTPGRKYHSMK